jgi:hypothetical protein
VVSRRRLAGRHEQTDQSAVQARALGKRKDQENKELKKKLQATDANLDFKTAKLEFKTAKLEAATADLQSKSAMHDKAISRFSKSPELLSEVAVSVCVVLTASLALFAWKRWRTKSDL